MAVMADVYFTGLPQPLRLKGPARLFSLVRRFFPTWYSREEACDEEASPVITVHAEGRAGWHITVPWLLSPLRERSETSLLCSLSVDMATAYFRANPSLISMHCAASAFNGRLVVFPNTNRAGKSTLVARLMAAGFTSFADDQLPITPEGCGISLGIPPRLRLPLPAGDDTLSRFFASHQGSRNKRYAYLDAQAPCLAPFGEQCPIGAFVLLARSDSGPARLVPADEITGLQSLVRQNLMRQGGSREVFNRSTELIKARPCWTLHYSSLDDAVTLLQEAFASADPYGFDFTGEHRKKQTQKPYEPLPLTAQDVLPARLESSPEDIYIRKSRIISEARQDDIFLIEEAEDAIYHLNPMAAAIWNMLEEPLSETDAAKLFSDVFSDTPPGQIEHDVAVFFDMLREKELIVKIST
ncbi:PqqD family protein [Oxalobacter sp. OttesenSCG-928-P03]|nr:PqqD family protein [Oxalobacter sp. OttesenSCG-928-P03]